MSISSPRSCANTARGSRKAKTAARAASRRGDAFMGKPNPGSGRWWQGLRERGLKDECGLAGGWDTPLAILRLEVEDQVALEHRLEARVRQRLGLQHGRLDRAPAQLVVRARRVDLG